MFQASRRYLPSAEALRIRAEQLRGGASTLLADAEDRARLLKGSAAGLLANADGARERLQKDAASLLAEAKAFAPHYEVPDTSFYALAGTSFNLLNGTTGPGLLALPLAFSRCGWLLGTLLLLIVFGFNYASLQLLLKSCLATREHSYIGLSMRAGPLASSLVDWASFAFSFGSCVSYLVIIGDSFDNLTSALGDTPFYRGGQMMHFSVLALAMLCTFTALVLAPLSMLRSMDSLQITSGVAVFCILYAASVVVISPTAHPVTVAVDHATAAVRKHRMRHGHRFSPPPPSPPPHPSPPIAPVSSAQAVVMGAQALFSVPTMAFCFASQPLFPPALETLHQPSTYHHVGSVVDGTMYVTLAIHLAVALGGYARYGDAVSANILDT